MPTKCSSRSSTGITKLPRRILGRSGPAVSEIGFGTWGLGGNAYGPTQDAESLAALRRAHDLGVTFFDTSDLYGNGHSERLLAQAFAGKRGEVFLATKAGYLEANGPQDFSPKHLEEALWGSLDRLQTRQVDLFQLHSPPLDLLYNDESLWEWLEDLKPRGRAHYVGVSVRSPADGLEVARDFDIDAIQVNFNLTDQRAVDNGLFAICAEKGIGVIVRTPLCFGFLSGTVANGEAFPNNDHRSLWSPAQREKWCEAVRLFDQLVASHPGQSAAQFALRFCLSQPGVTTVIPGMLTTEHVEDNLSASSLGTLTDDEMAQIAELYQNHTFFLGK